MIKLQFVIIRSKILCSDQKFCAVFFSSNTFFSNPNTQKICLFISWMEMIYNSLCLFVQSPASSDLIHHAQKSCFWTFYSAFSVLSARNSIPASTQIHLCHEEIPNFCLGHFKLYLNQCNYT